MKRISLLIVGLVALVFIQATPFNSSEAGDGIQFFEGTWEEALSTAKEEDKLIFLDAFTVWCGPCKLMKRNVFSQQTVGEYYNKSFVNVAMDMERGKGKEIAREYRVTAYPTLLFIDGDGNVVKKAVGYHPPEQFVSLGRSIGTVLEEKN